MTSMAAQLEPLPASIAVPPYLADHRVPGCESGAYVWVGKDASDEIEVYFAVENPQGVTAKALAVILSEGVKGAATQELLAIPEEIIFTIFGNELSLGKQLGLRSMIRKMKELAGKTES